MATSSENAKAGTETEAPEGCYDTLAPCNGDPSVEKAIVSADLPSLHLSMRLLPDSTEEDAVRVADCLAETLTSGGIWIAAPI